MPIIFSYSARQTWFIIIAYRCPLGISFASFIASATARIISRPDFICSFVTTFSPLYLSLPVFPPEGRAWCPWGCLLRIDQCENIRTWVFFRQCFCCSQAHPFSARPVFNTIRITARINSDTIQFFWITFTFHTSPLLFFVYVCLYI